MSLTFVSLFSGVGGFDLGLEAAGWECVAQVEWDKQCQAVLQRHWPDVPKWSDVSDVYACRCRPLQPCTHGGYALLAEDSARTRGTSCPCGGIPAADVIAFGSPCQDLSVAGKRAGLEGNRSGLFFEAIRIIKEMRDATAGTQPRFVIWENVAGALSSSGGWDFAAVIDSLAELGALDISWRILDARWFGVPQRRRRVFVIADFAGQCAGAIHAERAGVPWHPRTSGTERPVAATGTGTSAATGSRPVATTNVIGTLSPGAHPGGFNGQDAYTGQLIPVVPTHTHSPDDSVAVGPISHTQQPAGWSGSAQEADIAAPLMISRGGKPGSGYPAVLAFDSTFGNHSTVNDDLSPTIKVGTGLGIASPPAAMTQTAVRRLTPTECERLMGWNDDHTRWRADGTELADSTRYRMCGNGVASPVAEWIADMINMALEAAA